MLERAPTRMKLISPRRTVPNQIELSSPSSMSPISVALGATKQRAPNRGSFPAYGRRIMAADFSMPALTARLLVAILALTFLPAARTRVVHPGQLPPPLAGLPDDYYSSSRPELVT